MRFGFAVALPVAVLVMACGDDGGDPANYVALGELPSALRAARCTYLVRCGQFPDEATCRAANLPAFAEPFSLEIDANVRTAIERGRVLYSGTLIKRCLDAIASATCDTTDEDGRLLPQRCWNYLTGTVAGGGACVLDQECISQQCSGTATETSCVVGACIGDTPPDTVPAAVGMPCRFNPGCVGGAYCDSNAGTCMRAKGEGEPCFDADECAFGLGCAGNTGVRVCKPLPAVDQPCPDFVCRDEGTYCASAGTCQRLGLPPAVCTSSMQCAAAYPCDQSAGLCKPAPGLGQSCSSTSIVRCFDAGTACDGSTFTCIEPKPDGGSCNNELVCASGYCDTTQGTCAQPPLCST